VSQLAQVIASAGPDIAAYASSQPGPDRFVSLGEDGNRAYVLEAVYEGYLLHYGEPRAFVGMDPDLRLLAGDALYAQGLAALAEAGDMEAVAELSDLISLCAWAEAEGRSELVERLWDASSRRLLGGRGEGARAEVEPDLAKGAQS
jgi:hypothetical protein